MLALLWSVSAQANPHSGVDSQLYRPAVDSEGIFALDGADSLERYDLSFKLGVNYGQNPLKIDVPGIGDSATDPVLDFSVVMHMTIGFALTRRLTLALDTGLYRTDTGEGYGERGRYGDEMSMSTGLISLRPLSNLDPSGGYEPQGLSGPLDTRVGFKFQLADGTLKLAVLALASLPFGEDEMFLGDTSFVITPKLAVEYGLGGSDTSKVVANIGLNWRERTVLEVYDPDTMVNRAVFDLGSELVVGAGAVFAVGSKLVLGAEGVALLPLPAELSFGSCRLYDGSRCATLADGDYYGDAGYGDLAAYAMAGLRFQASAETALKLGGGLGLLGARRDDFRVLSGIVWTPTVTGAQRRGGGDRDHDGIPDLADICPDEVEDIDGFQDNDGCPEADNDNDGIVDGDDKCPDEPEDRDDNRDDDGCPERDNDGDKIPDVTDRCPNVEEDYDGFEDDDGCPEADNDKDGIADDRDKCPNEAETVNGVDDTDGCPDSRTQTGPVEDIDRISLRGNKIAFAGARSLALTPASRELLDQVADLIQQSNLRIRVEVHVPLSTRSRSRRAQARARRRDKRLAQRRADAIVKYLTSRKGVPAASLEALGLGSARPAQQPAYEPVNERVDFIKREPAKP